MDAAPKRATAGFGVGVLDDEDDDIYDHPDDLRGYDRMIGGPAPEFDRQGADAKKREAIGYHKDHDPVIEGFVRAESKKPIAKVACVQVRC